MERHTHSLFFFCSSVVFSLLKLIGFQNLSFSAQSRFIREPSNLIRHFMFIYLTHPSIHNEPGSKFHCHVLVEMHSLLLLIININILVVVVIVVLWLLVVFQLFLHFLHLHSKNLCTSTCRKASKNNQEHSIYSPSPYCIVIFQTNPCYHLNHMTHYLGQ